MCGTMPETSNAEFELAEKFALHTRKHCFITGKAGTGKTTLLKRIVERTHKNVVVVAPTGVAAINAGGVTLHSMFGLPLTCFIPTSDFVDLNAATNRSRLLHEHIHFRKEKQRVLKEMDLLIVDEVSMVRCDILDAVDFVLRTVRRSDQPFGGVQVLLFGDMHQLPPVVKEREGAILQQYYRSRYFFDSLVWPQLDAVEIELRRIYRQSDAQFLELLNHIREHRMEEADFARLRARYHPDFKAGADGYVLLATHNSRAESVNAAELARLPGKTYAFEAQIEGDFVESLFPCDPVLHLKAGAQVMFIRNDTEDAKYYNGKLAVVKRMDPENIVVQFREGGEDYVLHREKWEHIEYSLEAETGDVVKKELGTFSQFPLRLAWAITIHKSQGLTFDKVIIDAGRSFAAGQVYVALSRCRSLEGIVLHSLIPSTALHKDHRIGEFSARHHAAEELQAVLLREEKLYANHLLLRLFTFADLDSSLEEWLALIRKKDFSETEAASALYAGIHAGIQEIHGTAAKFRRQLQSLIAALDQDQNQIAVLRERCHKAIEYFTRRIAENLIHPLRAHVNELAYKKKMKRYLRQVQLIEEACWNKIDRLYAGQFLEAPLYGGEIVFRRDACARVNSSATRAAKAKGDTYTDTLELHRQGQSIQAIAGMRNLTVGTIKAHLARWVALGEIDVYAVLPAETVDAVLDVVAKTGHYKAGDIRRALGDALDYADIRLIVSHALREKNKPA